MGLERVSLLKVVEDKTYDKLKRQSEYLTGEDKVKIDSELTSLKNKLRGRQR